jgi:hypothetical protein
LTQKDMTNLIRKVRTSEFMRLQERYDGPFEDGSGFVITVKMDNMTHEVSFANPNDLKDNQDVQTKLLPLLIEILHKVPSPNPDQKPGAYQKR